MSKNVNILVTQLSSVELETFLIPVKIVNELASYKFYKISKIKTENAQV